MSVALWATSLPIPAQQASATYDLDIPAAEPAQALTELVAQTNLQVAYVRGLLPSSVLTHPITGSMSASDALEQMLRGTGLTFAFKARKSIEVFPSSDATRWFDIPEGPARQGIQAYLNTMHWQGTVDRNALKGAKTSAVRGCLSPNAAAEQLFHDTPLQYELFAPDTLGESPTRVLQVRATSKRSGWSALWRPEQMSALLPEGRPYRCWVGCQVGREDQPGGLTCLFSPAASRD